ncbi:MAG: MFS transporter [Halobacteriales archaeon]
MRDLLGNRNFRRLFLGRLVTNAGDSLYAVAAMWLVYSLSGSTAYAGLAGFLTLGPQALQAFVGPVVDRWPVRRLLVASQALQAVLVLTIPAAAMLGRLSAPLVLVVMPLVALLNQPVYPAQQAVLPRIVDDEALTAANSAFALAYQGVEFVFNAVAGVLVALVGAVTLYLVDSVTFAAAVVLFAGLRVPPAGDDSAGEPTGYLDDLREGLRFVRGTVLVWLFGASVIANALLGVTWAVLPAFADARGGAGLYGFLLAGLAGGMLVGALVAPRFDGIPYGRLSMAAFLLSGLAWFGALASPWAAGTVGLLGLAFVPVGVTNVVAQTMIQRLVPDGLLGRVTALTGSAGTAAMPVGSLVGGGLGELVGAGPVMVAGGVGFLWIVGYVAAVPALRRLPPASETETLDRAPAASPAD